MTQFYNSVGTQKKKLFPLDNFFYENVNIAIPEIRNGRTHLTMPGKLNFSISQKFYMKLNNRQQIKHGGGTRAGQDT